MSNQKKPLFSNKIRIVAMVVFFGIMVFAIGKLIFVSLTSDGVSTRKFIPEYQNLFTKQARGELDTPFNYESKYESFSSNYYYNNKYYLSVRSFFIPKNTSSIKELISVKEESPNFTGGTFSLGGSNFLEMGFKLEKADSIKKIELYLKGDSVTTVAKNDTMIFYYLKAQSFYMYYNGTTSPNIKGEARHGNTPVSMAFLKKNNKLYILIMNMKEAGAMQPNLLYSLISK